MQLGLLQKNNLWDTFDATFGLLCHPNTWIRLDTAAILASIARSMPHSDVWCCLFPALRRLLRADLSSFEATEILRTAEAPVGSSSVLKEAHFDKATVVSSSVRSGSSLGCES